MNRTAALQATTVRVGSMSHDGRGVAHLDGKVVFVDGALEGELVTVSKRKRRRSYDEARTVQVVEASARRITPRCEVFGTCGGCTMQHMDDAMQREVKQRALADALERVGGVEPSSWLQPVNGPAWHYRRRARLSCRFVERKGRVLVGFRERGNPYVTDMRRCEILSQPVDGLLEPLSELLGGLECGRTIPQVEVAVADNATFLVLRTLVPLPAADRDALRAFARRHGVVFYLQPGGPERIEPLDDSVVEALYRVDGVEFAFSPTGFIQVNAEVNRALVARAVELLEPAPGDRVLDLFCGLGNFTLPVARRVAECIGVEGDPGLVARARDNAHRNGIANAAFSTADLQDPDPGAYWAQRGWDKLLLDPPRAGAREVFERLPALAPSRIVYISCHPGTLARDAGILVNERGYRLESAGIVDMFPHTSHVESVAVFTA